MPFTKLHAALLRARLLAGENAEDIASEEDVPVKEIEKLIKKDAGKPQDIAVMRSDLVDPHKLIEYMYVSDGKIYLNEHYWITYRMWSRLLDRSADLEKEKKIMFIDIITLTFKDRKLRNVMQKYLMDYNAWRQSSK
jgi:hypothetical protein